MTDLISEVNYCSWDVFVRYGTGRMMQMMKSLPLASFRFSIV